MTTNKKFHIKFESEISLELTLRFEFYIRILLSKSEPRITVLEINLVT